MAGESFVQPQVAAPRREKKARLVYPGFAVPFVLLIFCFVAMGPEGSATQRLNLAQAFNPVGANIGVLLGAVLILPNLTPEPAKLIMTHQQLQDSHKHDLNLVLGPYLGIAAVLALIWALIA